MTCLQDHTHGAEILTDYCAGVLDKTRAAELEAHLYQCETCRRQVKAQRALWNALDAWPSLESSPDFDAKLYSRIAAEEAQPWWKSVLRPGWKPRTPWKPLLPFAAAAAAVAAVLLIWTPEPKSASQPAPAKAAAVEKIDVQQVEQALDDMDLLSPVPSSPRAL